MKVFINPGHDRKYDSGAIHQATMMREADIAAEVGELVCRYLKDAGCVPYIMQSDNLNGEGYHEDRASTVCDVANYWPADIFVSIHCNAFNCMARGTETLVYRRIGESAKLAECIQRQIVSSLDTIDRGVKEAPKLIVLKRTDMPAVLVEMAFIDNDQDFALLRDRKDDFARAIARGITDYQLIRNEGDTD